VVTAQGNLPTTVEGLLWRGRLSAVSGYSLGLVAPAAAVAVVAPVAAPKRARRRK
jgi:hypothetical protein